jgi:hypothetical protein
MAIDTARLQTDQSYRADLRNQGYFVGSEGGQVYAQQGGNPATGGGGAIISPSNPTGAAPTVSPGSQQLASGINSLLGAIASGNKQAFDEAVRQFNATFGLDKDKFAESVRQFNQNYLVSEAGLTGTYQGQQTQQAALQAANIAAQQAGLTGMFQGAPTLQAQNQAYNQQMGLVTTAAGLQANPFRQQQVIGQMGRLLGGGGVAGFSAPNTVAGVGTAGGNTQGGLGYLSQMIQDIRDPTPNQTSMNDVLNGIPTPNKINSNEFLRAAPSTQSMVLQGMQEKFGIDPNDALSQIKATLPQFTAPTTTFGTVKR